jgi:hypothetical protein
MLGRDHRITYEDATSIFEREYARSTGFGTAGLTLDHWDAQEVMNFLRFCDKAATDRGASLKGALVGVNVARKLGIHSPVGRGENFEEIPCIVTCGDDDRIDLIFGPTRK